MSMNFENPITDEQRSIIREMLGDKFVASDSKTVLFNQSEIFQKQMKEIANLTKQVVAVDLNSEGSTKTLENGEQYHVTPAGWEKLNNQ